MNTTGINGAQSSTYAPQTSGQKDKEDGLGQDVFLRLLTTQLAHQDPMQPQADTEFLAQLAQFSSLEQLTNISTKIQALTDAIAAQQGIGASTAASTADKTATNGGK